MGGDLIHFSRFWQLEFAAGGGPATAKLSQRLGALFAWAGQRLGAGPNHLTVMSLTLSLVASLVFATGPGTWGIVIVCFILYQAAYGFDCADGQLARATAHADEFGAWLDISCDCVSGIVLAFALLFYLHEHGNLGMWTLVVVWLLIVGRVLALYSSKAVKRSVYADQQHRFRARGVVKSVLWLAIDTPVFLTLVCVLRQLPRLEAGYLVLIGGGYLCKACYNGARLRPAN